MDLKIGNLPRSIDGSIPSFDFSGVDQTVEELALRYFENMSLSAPAAKPSDEASPIEYYITHIASCIKKVLEDEDAGIAEVAQSKLDGIIARFYQEEKAFIDAGSRDHIELFEGVQDYFLEEIYARVIKLLDFDQLSELFLKISSKVAFPAWFFDNLAEHIKAMKTFDELIEQGEFEQVLESSANHEGYERHELVCCSPRQLKVILNNLTVEQFTELYPLINRFHESYLGESLYLKDFSELYFNYLRKIEDLDTLRWIFKDFIVDQVDEFFLKKFVDVLGGKLGGKIAIEEFQMIYNIVSTTNSYELLRELYRLVEFSQENEEDQDVYRRASLDCIETKIGQLNPT